MSNRPLPPALRLLIPLGVFLLALAAFGARYHWVEEAGTAERDGYVAKAEEMLAGSVPRDPFRPLLYPLLTAGLARLGIPAFTAARLLSNLAAVGVVALAWGFGRRLGGPRLGAWAAAATAVNPNVWILGQHTTTDMSFAALAGACLLAGLAYLERPGWRAAVAAGLTWGAAAFTRGNAVFLLPPLLLAWWLGGRKEALGAASGGVRRWAHLATAAAPAIAVLVPHWVLRNTAFGDPFHDENWKNLAFKLYGFPDWSYLDRVPFAGPWEVLTADPGAVVCGAAGELGRFFASGLAQLLGTPLHALLLLAGIVAALRFRPLRAGWVVAAAGVFLAATALAFFTWGRLLLVLLPLGNPFVLAVFAEPGDALRRRAAAWLGRLRPIAVRALPRLSTLAAAGLVALLALKTFAFRLPAFVDRHPYDEVAVLERLDRTLPPGVVLAGTSPFLGRYLDRRYVALRDAFGEEVEQPRLYFESLRPLLEDADVGYVVAGEVDLRARPRALLDREAPVPWLERVEREGRVAVWRFRRSGKPPSPGVPTPD